MQSLFEDFQKKFEVVPEFIAYAPGRVNLIGEHIDYSGYGVLPFAIDKNIKIAVAISPNQTNPPTISFFNTNEKYPSVHFNHEPVGIVEIDSSVSHWGNYIKGAYKAAFDAISSEVKPKSFIALVDGSIPAGAGVSSSAGLVVATVLATTTANAIKLELNDLVQSSIAGEHNVGVHCGGMDQSISVLAQQSHALNIDFYPTLTSKKVRLPSRVVFVVANSLVVSDKHVTAARNYNLRVAEMRLATLLVAKKLNLNIEEIIKKNWCLRYVQDIVEKKESLERGAGLPKIADLVNELPDYLSFDEIAKVSEVDAAWLLEKTADGMAVDFDEVDGLKVANVGKRARHVIGESLRVDEFVKVCNDENVENTEILGKLMNDSHESCDSLFECSHPKLNELVQICRQSPGCYGSRLTGAGWGGCTISMVDIEKVDRFVENVTKEYYQERCHFTGEIGDVLFVTRAGEGAG
ncbi:N-acetylgalactosamine kinase, partial [Nowakowskiella sp. JEL0078]